MAAVANVAINLDSRGVPAKLKQIADRSKEVSVAVDRMNGKVGESSKQFKNAGVAASQASAGFSKLGKAIGRIATVAAAFQALKFTIVKTAELETQTRSLKVLTGSLKSAQTIIKQLQDIGAVTPFTSTELIDTAKRLRAFGVETDKLVDTTRRLGDVAGATGADLGGIATAFGQIQAKGRLQGEELLQLQERGIDLQSELQRMYGMTGEEFRKALEKGKFSAEAVDVALQNLTNTGGKYANGAIAQSDTLAGKFSTLQDGITRTAQAIGQVLSPALQTILTQAIGVVNSINNALAAGRRIQQFGIDASKRNELFQQAGREAEEIAKLRGGGKIDPAVFTQLRDERFKDLIEAYGYKTGQIQVETKVPTLETPSVPELLGGGAAGGGGSGGGTAGGRTGRGPSAEDILKDQLAAGERIAKQLQREINLRNASNDLERELLGIKFNYEDVVANINANAAERQREELLNLAERNRLDQENLATIEARDKRLQEAFKMDFASLFKQDQGKLQQFISDSQDSLNDLEQVAINVSQGVGSAISGSLVNGIQGLIEGSEKVKDVFANMLKSVGQVLAQEGARMIATYIAIGVAKAFAGLSGGTKFGDMGNFDQAVPGASGFSSPSSFDATGLFGARANGGPVNANQPYIVGERGPELFMPFSSGMVLSNNDTREKLEQQDAVMSDNATREQLEQQDAAMRDSATREQLEQQDAVLRDSATRDRLKQQDAAMRDSATRDKLEQQDAVIRSNETTRQQLIKQQNTIMRSNEATRQQLIKQQNTMTTNRIREVERTSLAMMASPGPIDVRYESSVINNVEYVTADQHRQGMAQAAERGRVLTLQALQNSVKSRRKVGLA